MFLLVTEHFCEDALAQMQKDDALMESINKREKRWCVINSITTNVKVCLFIVVYASVCHMSVSSNQQQPRLQCVDVVGHRPSLVRGQESLTMCDIVSMLAHSHTFSFSV